MIINNLKSLIMKTKNLFLVTMVALFGAVVESSGQNNTVVGVNNATPATDNVLVGHLAGNATMTGDKNTFVGKGAGNANTTGTSNTALGYGSLWFNTTGSNNIAINNSSLEKNTSGNHNIGIGFASLMLNIGGNNNIGMGIRAGQNSQGDSNIFIGEGSGFHLNTGNANFMAGYYAGHGTTGGSENLFLGHQAGYTPALYPHTSTRNTYIGYQSGWGVLTGSYNTFLGTVLVPNGLATTTLAGTDTKNTIVLADGESNQRLYIHGGETLPANLYKNGNTGIGLGNNVIPQNRLEVKSAFTADPYRSSGVRLTNLTNTTVTPITNPTNGVLSVDNKGNVIWVNDKTGGVTQNCSTANFVPVNSATAGQLNCSQIFDNGTSVGIGTTGAFNYTYNTGDFLALAPASGTAKLRVNGVAWTTGYYASSDKKFKKDIKPIENALEKVQQIEGKTYAWNTESNKDMNFDNGGHSGFIAQELEKVLPHLVATDEKGNKAVNYIELMPYLIEAIKDQQTQINDLKSQITENFKAQNQDLIELTNTKIISVSPNPSSDLITVSFNVEKSVESAKLQVHDLNGNVISSLNINDRENNITRTLQKDNFGKGIYVVSLVINGKSIDTKKIVFN